MFFVKTAAARAARSAMRSRGAGIAARTARRNYLAPVRDMRFCINDVHGFESHYQKLGVAEKTEGMLDAVLDETAKIAQDVLVPLNETELVGVPLYYTTPTCRSFAVSASILASFRRRSISSF